MHTGSGFGTLPPATSLTAVGFTASGTTPLPTAHRKTIVVAPGLPALDRTVVELILAELFVDLAELPPAKGHAPAATNRPLDSLTQPANPVQPKRLIPDLGTWVQCFSLYTAVLLTKHPHRATSLMLYQKNIGYLSQRFRWPAVRLQLPAGGGGPGQAPSWTTVSMPNTSTI